MATNNIRSSWKGQVILGGVGIDVVAKPATGDPPGVTATKRLCACHKKPFSQLNTCPGGLHPTSGAAVKRGEKDLTDVVYGIEADDGSYVVIDPSVLTEISESTALAELVVEEVVPVATADVHGFPLHLAEKAYFLAHDKDGDAMASYDLAALHSALRASGHVAVAKWSQRGPQMLVGIYAMGDTLMMSVVPFAAETREPDLLVLGHSTVKVDADDLDATADFLADMTSQAFDHGAYEDDAVPQIEATIERALAAAKKGKKIKVAKRQSQAAAAPRRGSLASRLGKGKAGKAAAKPAKRAGGAPRAKAR